MSAYLTRDDLPENTKENPQAIGTLVKLPSNWETTLPNYVSLSDGSIVTKSTKVASVYAVSVGNGNTVPIPVGFHYVGGTLDTGVVISDKYEDSYENNKRDMTSHADAINLVGNQFVWIPCETEEYVKSNWSSDGKTQGNVTGRSNCYWGTGTNTSELVQIEKYGGYYVSRYEAGLPEGTTEFKESISKTSNIYNSIDGTPQSKAGISPWNFIDWNNSQIKAKEMYKEKTNVVSGLITGTQWDVMINKIGSLKDKSGNTKYSLIDSSSWGNFYNSEEFDFRGEVSEFSSNIQYEFTTVTTTIKQKEKRYLLKTGASEHNKAYNLYDVAGNLWEWTEENNYATTGKDVSEKRMLRGGVFAHDASSFSACYRLGGLSATQTDATAGFRVVLYMK